ncbi:DUF6470 family protein [Lederbergia lenta]|uniref:DUF6470 family protein n=1 Tax=Lederbergia lenta TaxID=1467 RepID=UPI00203ACF63|nr:DUF6470 family protein [Lederbergia lenta]MCM3111744.1 DUF6470 family protein [Lederbergia lenta]
MQMPQIRMQSQSAQLAIQTQPSYQSIQQPKADLQIKQNQATMTIRTTPGKLTIDQTQAWEEMGIKSVFRSNQENTQKAKQAVLQGIARVSREGDEMLQSLKGRNVAAEQAARKANPPPSKTYITYIPSNFSVKTHYQPGKTEIRFIENKPVIQARTQKPIISYHQGKVDFSLKQHNSLKIDFVK